MPKLQHLEGNAFYSERDINCFPQFRTLLQARVRKGDDTRRLKIIWQTVREAAMKSGVRALAQLPGCRFLLRHAPSRCARWGSQSDFCGIRAAREARRQRCVRGRAPPGGDGDAGCGNFDYLLSWLPPALELEHMLHPA